MSVAWVLVLTFISLENPKQEPIMEWRPFSMASGCLKAGEKAMEDVKDLKYASSYDCVDMSGQGHHFGSLDNRVARDATEKK